MRFRAYVTVVAAAMLLAGCGSTKAVTVTSQSTVTQQAAASTAQTASNVAVPASSSPTSCETYLSGYDAELGFRSATLKVQPDCQSWIHNNASQGQLWTEQAPSEIPSDLSIVCQLSDPEGKVQAVVLDDGGQTYGQNACTGLISAGWIENGN
jgi:hypothetical protein